MVIHAWVSTGKWELAAAALYSLIESFPRQQWESCSETTPVSGRNLVKIWFSFMESFPRHQWESCSETTGTNGDPAPKLRRSAVVIW